MLANLLGCALAVSGLTGGFLFARYLAWLAWDPFYRLRRAGRYIKLYQSSRGSEEATQDLKSLNDQELEHERSMSRLSLFGLVLLVGPMVAVVSSAQQELLREWAVPAWTICSVIGAIFGILSGLSSCRSHRQYESAVLRRFEGTEEK